MKRTSDINWVRRLWAVSVVLIWLVGCSSPQGPPNIVLFLVDDLGWQDCSLPFAKDTTEYNRTYRTPNMEKLARQGIKFTRAYASPVCSPTRVSLLSGMNAARHRVTNWTLHPDRLQPMELNHPDLEFPMWNVNGLSSDTMVDLAAYASPLPAILQESGYKTIHIGKAHFGAIGKNGADPTNLGFDINIAGHAAGAPGSYFASERFGNHPDGKRAQWAVPHLADYYDGDQDLTEVLTREAIDQMTKAVALDQPFFLYLSHYTVHTPISPERDLVDFYLNAGMDTIEAYYASMIEGMDRSLGEVLDYLEHSGLYDNTIVLFMSDNGGLSAHTRAGQLHTHNLPLSGGKGSALEGGIRVPMIVRWPGHAQAGTTCNSPVIIEDFYPSILEMAGIVSYDPIQVVDGQSFVDLIQAGATTPRGPLVWHYPNDWGPSGPGIGAFSAMVSENSKIIYYHKNQEMVLYDLEEDMGEKTDLSALDTVHLKEMATQLTDLLIKRNAQMPNLKETGERVPWPSEALGNYPEE